MIKELLEQISRLRRWKQKATRRQKEIKLYKQRLKELIKSRDSWKNKAQTYQEKIQELEQQKTALEAELKKNF